MCLLAGLVTSLVKLSGFGSFLVLLMGGFWMMWKKWN
ncbi:Na_H_Exchanger domain-containing protein [Psidium guajava]|nr:Na_H_Exchanger domain-containing protein [Psidium guajava]